MDKNRLESTAHFCSPSCHKLHKQKIKLACKCLAQLNVN